MFKYFKINKTFSLRIKTISPILFKFSTIFPYTNNSNIITDMHTFNKKKIEPINNLIKTVFSQPFKMKLSPQISFRREVLREELIF